MTPPVRPALTPEQWQRQSTGTVRIELIDDNVHVAVRDNGGAVVNVSGTDELFALMALTNHALPNDDPGKFTRADAAIIAVLIDLVDRHSPDDVKLIMMTEAVRAKLIALLPALA